MCVCVCVCTCTRAHTLCRVQLFATLWTVAFQDPLSIGFSRQENPGGCHFLLQGIFMTQGPNPCLLHLLHLAGRFFTTAPSGKKAISSHFLMSVIRLKNCSNLISQLYVSLSLNNSWFKNYVFLFLLSSALEYFSLYKTYNIKNTCQNILLQSKMIYTSCI